MKTDLFLNNKLNSYINMNLSRKDIHIHAKNYTYWEILVYVIPAHIILKSSNWEGWINAL